MRVAVFRYPCSVKKKKEDGVNIFKNVPHRASKSMVIERRYIAVMAVILSVSAVLIVFAMAMAARRSEGFTYECAKNPRSEKCARNSRENYYYTSGNASFPWDMFSRARNVSPGFYSGSGHRYERRPGAVDDLIDQPRARWIHRTRGEFHPHYRLSNAQDYIHGEY